MREIKKSFFSSFDVEKKLSELCIFTITIGKGEEFNQCH